MPRVQSRAGGLPCPSARASGRLLARAACWPPQNENNQFGAFLNDAVHTGGLRAVQRADHECGDVSCSQADTVISIIGIAADTHSRVA